MIRTRIDGVLTAWVVVVLTAIAPARAETGAETDTARHWNFQVYLNDTPIGWQHFTLDQLTRDRHGDERSMDVEAKFAVKFLGFTVYRYQHHAHAQWRGDCLQALRTRTDDDGDKYKVDSEHDGDTLVVIVGDKRIRTDSCPMTFAYWNPAILQRTRLINTQTGKYETVDIRKIGSEKISVRGNMVEANHYRIAGIEQPIDLWYSDAGDWLALSSRVSDGKLLRYELQ